MSSRTSLRGLSFAAPEIPIVSNLTGSLLRAEEVCSPEYWVRHARRAVRFLDGVRWLEGNGVASYLELGPDGVLCAMARSCLSVRAERARGEHSELVLASTLRAKRPEVHTLTSTLAELRSRPRRGLGGGARRVGSTQGRAARLRVPSAGASGPPPLRRPGRQRRPPRCRGLTRPPRSRRSGRWPR